MASLGSGGTRIALPRADWYLARESRDVGRRPVSRTVLGTPLVLFRTGAGETAALLDRCAHRNLPLSEGRIVGAQIGCPYHGWRYDREGQCRAIPALVEANDLKGRAMQAFPVKEQQGLVWVFMDPGPAASSASATGRRPFAVTRLRRSLARSATPWTSPATITWPSARTSTAPCRHRSTPAASTCSRKRCSMPASRDNGAEDPRRERAPPAAPSFALRGEEIRARRLAIYRARILGGFGSALSA